MTISTPSPSITLADDYYLDNFRRLLDHAVDHYFDLLTVEEKAWITRFKTQSKASQCLLVRLLSRKGDWFRTDKLNYPEIGNIESSLNELQQDGFVEISPTVRLSSLPCSLLNKSELLILARINNIEVPNKQIKKEPLYTLASECLVEQGTFEFSLVQLVEPDVIAILLILFFGNTRQDLTQFVLSDLGLNKFEDYPLSKELRYFQSREDINQLLRITAIKDALTNLEHKQVEGLSALAEAVQERSEHRYVERLRQHVINDIARDLERVGALDIALQLYKTTQVIPSRERQVRIHLTKDQAEDASSILETMLSTPLNIEEHEVAERLSSKVTRALGHTVKRVAKPSFNETAMSLDLSQQRVEQAVVNHFNHNGYQAFHCENTWLGGLFGLCYWDAIYAPVEGAFINAYQHRPLDLYHEDFLEKRRAYFEQANHQLQVGGFEVLKQHYTEKLGVINPFVHWDVFTLEVLELTEQHLSIEELYPLFSILLSDIKRFRNGMPDLIAFGHGHWRWIEVKGPGDKLQHNQVRWINAAQKSGKTIEVLYVNPPE